MDIIPLWVQLSRFPLQYWTQENLEHIKSYLGTLIYTNKLTARSDGISYAKMLIEMDITQLFLK